MMPILFSWTAWESGLRTGNGTGILMDAVSCTVTEEINGVYELTMKYPIAGIHGNEIRERDIVIAKPNIKQRAQPFRIYRMTRPIGGVFTVYARHISYVFPDLLMVLFHQQSMKGSCSGAYISLYRLRRYRLISAFQPKVLKLQL